MHIEKIGKQFLGYRKHQKWGGEKAARALEIVSTATSFKWAGLFKYIYVPHDIAGKSCVNLPLWKVIHRQKNDWIRNCLFQNISEVRHVLLALYFYPVPCGPSEKKNICIQQEFADTHFVKTKSMYINSQPQHVPILQISIYLVLQHGTVNVGYVEEIVTGNSMNFIQHFTNKYLAFYK